MWRYWAHAVLWAFESDQAEDVSVEVGGFGEYGESRGVFSLAGPERILAAGGEFFHQGLKAVNGPSVAGLSGLFFALDGFSGLGLGGGVAVPAVGVEFSVLEEHANPCLSHVPFDVIREQA